jgi:hypothetical protein
MDYRNGEASFHQEDNVNARAGGQGLKAHVALSTAPLYGIISSACPARLMLIIKSMPPLY